MLLERLSRDREEILSIVIASGKKKVFCSCGSAFTEITEAENHFVQHEKLSQDTENSSLDDDNKGISILQDEYYMFETLKELIQRTNERKKKANDSLIDISKKFKSRFEFAVVISESEIDMGSLADLDCPLCETTKPVKISSFEEMKKHFLINHPQCWMPKPHGQILTSKAQLAGTPKKKNHVFKYFCPIPCCKYHIFHEDNDDGEATEELPKTFFTSLKALKQHYVKAHCRREFVCNRCAKSFPLNSLLTRHRKLGCDTKFQCLTCVASYSNLESLQTHCRRYGHHLDNPVKKSKASTIIAPISFTEEGFVKIAPRPSHPHLKAAIALSQLSNDFVAKPPKIDIGIQKDFDQMRKDTAEIETQTLLGLTLPPASALDERNPENKRARIEVLNDEFDSALMASTSRPPWTQMSTQTSPARQEQETMTINELLFSSSIDLPGKMYASTSGAIPPMVIESSSSANFNRRLPPKIGEIEQFSTETQTDFQLRSMTAAATTTTNTNHQASQSTSCWESYDSVEFPGGQFDAGTQFDLDDILCSNYTQTGFSELLGAQLPSSDIGIGKDIITEDPVVGTSASAFNSIETQTAFHSIETQTIFQDEEDIIERSKSSTIETQTSDNVFE